MPKSKNETAAATKDPRPPVPEEAGKTASGEEKDQAEKAPEEAADVAVFRVTYPFGLNLRAGPGKGYPVLSVLPVGAEVRAAGERVSPSDGGAWLPVETCQGGGWVDTAYLCLASEG